MTGLKGLYGVASVRSLEAEWLSRSAPGALMARAAAAVKLGADVRMVVDVDPQSTL